MVTPYTGTIPNRSAQTQAEFSANVDEFLTWLAVHAVPEINEVAVGATATGTFNALQVNNIATIDGGIAGTGVGYMLRSRTVITATGAGTYTPNAKARAVNFRAQGAGGGAGGVDGQTASDSACSTGGQGGGYVERFVIGPLASSYSYSVGVKGTGGAAGNNAGSDGGDTTVSGTGVAITATGGRGTAGVTASPNASAGVVDPLASTGGDINTPTRAAIRGIVRGGVPVVLSNGGDSQFGSGGPSGAVAGGAGSNAVGRGAGGGGAVTNAVATNFAGGSGGDGLLIIEEYW